MESKNKNNKSRKQNENRLINTEKKPVVARGLGVWGKGMKNMMWMKRKKISRYIIKKHWRFNIQHKEHDQ